MLSVLIRTYNASVFEIVSEINQQCQKLNMLYEILISDDYPSGKIVNEEELKKFPQVTYWKNITNLGRSNNLNKLIKVSKYDVVLLLDNDTFPLRSDFINTYLKKVEEGFQAIYGGLAYEKKQPDSTQRLRWLYGHKKEAKSAQIRKEKFKHNVLVSNLIIKKSAFHQPIFDTELTTYGYEDLIFSEKLKNEKIKVCQIDNPVIHKGLETSSKFLDKTEIALDNLIQLIKKKKVSEHVTALSRLYFKMKSKRVLWLFLFLLKPFQDKIRKKLISEQPSLFWFDVYRLYYFSKHFQKK